MQEPCSRFIVSALDPILVWSYYNIDTWYGIGWGDYLLLQHLYDMIWYAYHKPCPYLYWDKVVPCIPFQMEKSK